MSKIEWTEKTWNPVAGCTKISPGCKNCYAEKMAVRLRSMGVRGYENGFSVSLVPERLDQPVYKRKPVMYFVCSMSDLFQEDVPFEYIDKVMSVINSASWHTYQILTKRAQRMSEYFSSRPCPTNAWVGVSVEDRKYGIPRINHLKTIDAAVRFLSIEPLLEDVGILDLTNINWVIVGGESGVGARQMNDNWVYSIQNQCKEASVDFFFKQWGSWGADGVRRSKQENGRLLNGRTWDAMPQKVAL